MEKNIFFEVWLRGYAKDTLKALSATPEDFFPHLTYIRPLASLVPENELKQKIINYCKNHEPIRFVLEGTGQFNQNIYFIDVKQTNMLEKFNTGLEEAIKNDVQFDTKLDAKKKFHVTVKNPKENLPELSIEQYMLRFTALKDKKIWFSYDFVFKRELSRDESLDKSLWYKTVHEFTNQSGLLPTKQGYKALSKG